MPRSRKGACALVLLAMACVPALCGCAGTETEAASAESHSGLIGGFVEQLKQEDDEQEVKELAEHESSKEEREEAHEQLEREQLEASQGEGQQPEEG